VAASPVRLLANGHPPKLSILATFEGTTDPLMWEFNQSLRYDKRMRAQDIRGSIAYTKALRIQGVYTKEEEADMIKGLQAVDKEWESGKVGQIFCLSTKS
jgi:argininosuccinate lyase